jgi:hypothetical protein
MQFGVVGVGIPHQSPIEAALQRRGSMPRSRGFFVAPFLIDIFSVAHILIQSDTDVHDAFQTFGIDTSICIPSEFVQKK